jgi:hypothetical protein
MGAWGCNSFDNDDALDFIGELLDTGDVALLDDAVAQVAGGSGVDDVTANRALAAADIVAAQHGNPAADLPEELSQWIADHPGPVDLQPARDAVIAVLTDSELLELWKESGNYRKWRASTMQLLKRLGGAMPVAAPNSAITRRLKPCHDHPGVPPIDEKARIILIAQYWSTIGWKMTGGPAYHDPSEDERYALEAGFFIQPRLITHDEVIAWVCRSVSTIQRSTVSNAFLASLSSRRLELRSALGSYAAGRHLAPHPFSMGKFFRCDMCGLSDHLSDLFDFSEMNFERHKWSGLDHTHPAYIAFDLDELAKLPPCQPTTEDIAMLQQIIATASTLPPQAGPSVLVKQLQHIIPTNSNESELLLTILGYCGILQPASMPSFADHFVDYTYRASIRSNDWVYPISKWRGRDGVNTQALAFYFPQLDR